MMKATIQWTLVVLVGAAVLSSRAQVQVQGNGNVAIGQISGGIVQIGVTSDQLTNALRATGNEQRRQLNAIATKINSALQKASALPQQTSRDEGNITEDIVRGFLATVSGYSIPKNEWPKKLNEIATKYAEYVSRLSATPITSKNIRDLVFEAQDAQKQGDVLAVGTLLDEVTKKTEWNGAILFIGPDPRADRDAIFALRKDSTVIKLASSPHRPGRIGRIEDLACSPDGQRFAIQEINSSPSTAPINLGLQSSSILIGQLSESSLTEVIGENARGLGNISWGGPGEILNVQNGYSSTYPGGPRTWLGIEVASRKVTKVHDQFSSSHYLRVSPDGTRIALAGNQYDFFTGKVFVGIFVRDVSEPRIDLYLIPEGSGDLAWSSDSRQLAYGKYHSVKSADGQTESQNEIWIRNLREGKNFQLTVGSYDSHISWSPDDQWIIFQRRTSRDKPAEIFMVRTIEGAEPVKLTFPVRNARLPAWCR